MMKVQINGEWRDWRSVEEAAIRFCARIATLNDWRTGAGDNASAPEIALTGLVFQRFRNADALRAESPSVRDAGRWTAGASR